MPLLGGCHSIDIAEKSGASSHATQCGKPQTEGRLTIGLQVGNLPHKMMDSSTSLTPSALLC
jgi:hypothetical protein